MKFHGTEVKYRRALQIYKTVPTTRDHRVVISEIQAMSKVADLREQILLEVYLMGFRVGDVALLEWRKFDQNGEPPIPVAINTKKEQVVARAFISEEFKQLLDKYLPLLDKSNPYLFQSKRRKHLSTKQINNRLKKLVERTGITNHGLFRWHTGRKIFLRTCAELGISSWSAKLMCGKSIPASDDTYVHDAELKNDFKKISEVLRLFSKSTPQTEDELKNLKDALRHVEKENTVFKTRLDLMQKDFQNLRKSVEEIYPKQLPLWVPNEEGRIDVIIETFNSPEEYLERIEKYKQELLAHTTKQNNNAHRKRENIEYFGQKLDTHQPNQSRVSTTQEKEKKG